MEYKTIIDSNGFIVEECCLFLNDNVIEFTMKEGQRAVKRYIGHFIRPRWNGSEWVEGATEEEIQASKEEKKENEENIKPSAEERILVLESAIEDLATMICELSEGVKSND